MGKENYMRFLTRIKSAMNNGEEIQYHGSVTTKVLLTHLPSWRAVSAGKFVRVCCGFRKIRKIQNFKKKIKKKQKNKKKKETIVTAVLIRSYYKCFY